MSRKTQTGKSVRYDGTSKHGNSPASNCKSCGGPETEEMVQCDSCDRWFHFQCVNVTESIAERPWNCADCTSRFEERNPVSTFNFPPNVPPARRSLSHTHPAEENVANVPQTTELMSQLSIPSTNIAPSSIFPPLYNAPTIAFAPSRNINPRLISNQNTQSMPISTTSCSNAVVYPSTMLSAPVPSAVVSISKTPISSRRNALPVTVGNKLPIQRANDERSLRNEGPANQLQQKATTSSRKSTANRAILLELEKLKEEQKHLQEVHKQQMDNINKRYELLAELASESSLGSVAEEIGLDSKVEDWLDQSDGQRVRPFEEELHYPLTHRSTHNVAGPHSYSAPKQAVNQRHSSGKIRFEPQIQPTTSEFQGRHRPSFEHPPGESAQDHHQLGNTQLQTVKDPFFPQHRSTPQHSHFPSVMRNAEIGDLTNSRAAARQAFDRELPTFSGLPEEWPLFLSTFNTTTSMCGFTQEENLIRLQKCLKGKAFDAVRCMLMHPSNVTSIISTLRMLFGNPEVIIYSLISKIQSTPAPRADRLGTLVEFALSVKNLCATIEACQLEEFTYNVTLIRELIDKLPTPYQVDWAKHRRTLIEVNLSKFSEWLYDLAETVSPIVSISSNEFRLSRTTKKGVAFLNAHSEDDRVDLNFSPYATHEEQRNTDDITINRVTERFCLICKGNCPKVEECKRFVEMTYKARWDVVHEFNLCKRCLRRHGRKPCKSQKLCGQNGCDYKHHPYLHKHGSEPNVQEGHMHHHSSNQVLYRVVPVILYGPEKKLHTYAFLDDGSSVTLVDSTIAGDLGIKGKLEPLCLKWTGNRTRQEKESENIWIEISGTEKHHKRYELPEVHTVKNLDLFHQTLDMEQLRRRYHHLKGVPAKSYHDVQPRILIGSNNANLGYALRGREGNMYEPVATKTRLGWIVYGGSDKIRRQFPGFQCFHHCECRTNSDNILHEAVKEFFAIEKAGIEKPIRLIESNDDRRARTILESLQRTDNGRYKLRLLWKFDKFRLPESRNYALRRAHCLETKLKKQPQLAAILSEKMKDYVSKGYVRKLTDDELAENRPLVWYLPIFPVFNANKPNKVRMVWDAAAKVHGISLNSMLLKGPDQNCALTDVLIRFRANRIAVCGDIREMFHQVLISEEDQHCQRFLWKDNVNDAEPSTYVMQVMTFGASCSPSSAQYVKNYNAQQYQGQYPLAAAAITNSHYVDDMLLSVESEQEAIQLAKEVRFIHAQAGFEMRNWLSNSRAVVTALNECGENEKSLNIGDQTSTEKVLGMWWCTSTDCFTYKLSPKHEEDLLAGKRVPTKREVLRTLMAIFDPLGFLSNLLIVLKVILQEIWRSTVGWDDQIPMKLFDDWLQWLSVLPRVKDIKIPRCYLSNLSVNTGTLVTLHTFVDASELAYAAVTYIRFQQGDTVECAIVGAKARVAPLRFLSIPRMELQAAVIGVRLADTISNALCFKINQRIFWSDSRDVLCWLRSDHRRYSHYVGHRVSEILETTQVGDWKWVPTEENVADEATKWQRLPDLNSECRWLNGPEFLREDEAAWPCERFGKSYTEEELRPNVSCNVHSLLPAPFIQSDRFRSWNLLRRTAAWILRFAHNARYKKYQEKWTGPLSGKELHRGEVLMFRQAQNEFFIDEINSLASTSPTPTIHKSSPIYKLWPFLDDEQVLRAATRIEACEAASMDAKNPIILPKDHPISRLIVQHYHVKFYHRNHQTVINELRQRFRVTPRLSSLYWKVRANCQLCKNLKAAPRPPRMSNLPSTRLSTFTRPFSFVGIDYFGPMFVSVKRSTEKRWGVLITCLTVRAIHIEIAHSLSAESCIMALRNFMGRRGTPTKIFSDRGTNFIGANKELKVALGEMDQKALLQEISSPETTWSFIPPVSPHMGGSWERMIQTVKRNLNQIKPKHQLNDEVLRNLLVEVENTVNSRPLTHVSSEDPEQPVLTPNHFLVGSSNGLKPASLLDDSEKAVRRTWRSSQVEANIFWKRWVRDYLPDLTQRSKWHTPAEPIQVDDIVVIVDANLPRNCWPIGRVISAEASCDGEVRKAVVQTANGIYERPAVKLAVLDVRRKTE